jgi:uncharacterized protein YecE (DUF72 family)
MTGRILVGTASWTDPSLIASGRFYPADAKTPESRLHFYASQFPVVEVDSSYYGLPAQRMAATWVERTPDNFIFDIKAYSALTHHPTQVRSLPKDLRELLPDSAARRTIYYKDLPEEVRDGIWERFADALLPLDSAGKLGVVVFQFPFWFLPGRASRDYIEQVKARLPQYLPAIEFRNPLWFEGESAEQTLWFLKTLDLPFVCVDEPQGTRASVPPVVRATGPIAVVRFHGRNREAWARRGASVAEKYDYLYSPEELSAWQPAIQQLSGETRETHVIMNNCHDDKAVRNARQLATMLGAAAPTAPDAPQQGRML